MTQAERTTSTGYTEKLWPAWWVWFLTAGMAVSFGLVGLRFGTVQAVLATFGGGAVLLALLLRGIPTVTVAGGRFRVGRAQVPLALLGGAVALDAAGMARERGPALDARAHLFLRGWVPTGVRVDLADPRDPSPYWLVSSRHPQALAEAITGG